MEVFNPTIIAEKLCRLGAQSSKHPQGCVDPGDVPCPDKLCQSLMTIDLSSGQGPLQVDISICIMCEQLHIESNMVFDVLGVYVVTSCDGTQGILQQNVASTEQRCHEK